MDRLPVLQQEIAITVGNESAVADRLELGAARMRLHSYAILHTLLEVPAPSASLRAELFRLLGDEDRLRLLALCDAEELTVGELAVLLHQSQPQVTRKTQPLRDAGLLHERRDGTRILLRTESKRDPVVAAALEAGRSLCLAEGQLARVPAVVAQREEASRRFFAEARPRPATLPGPASDQSLRAILPFATLLAPMLPGHSLAVDLGTGEGTLLPLLSPIYDRVIAVDRSAARLARAAERISALGLPNVRLREASVEDTDLGQEVARSGGADLVTLARLLHHVARPQDVLASAKRLLRPGGHLVVVDHLPHDKEELREQGHVWLGFDPGKLCQLVSDAGLTDVATVPLRSQEVPPLQLASGRMPTDSEKPKKRKS
jgi:SAM-dependent methyltransferase/DNA-binding transcriptional ArsR family regulator